MLGGGTAVVYKLQLLCPCDVGRIVGLGLKH